MVLTLSSIKAKIQKQAMLWYQCGLELTEIHDKKLFRKWGFTTWTAFCDEIQITVNQALKWRSAVWAAGVLKLSPQKAIALGPGKLSLLAEVGYYPLKSPETRQLLLDSVLTLTVSGFKSIARQVRANGKKPEHEREIIRSQSSRLIDSVDLAVAGARKKTTLFMGIIYLTTTTRIKRQHD